MASVVQGACLDLQMRAAPGLACLGRQRKAAPGLALAVGFQSQRRNRRGEKVASAALGVEAEKVVLVEVEVGEVERRPATVGCSGELSSNLNVNPDFCSAGDTRRSSP